MLDATLIAAPPSTKNKERKPDPEMGSTRKGSQSYSGMKAHICADPDRGLAHSLIFTGSSTFQVEFTRKPMPVYPENQR